MYSLVRVKVMNKNIFKSQLLFDITLFFSLFLIFLDSYQILSFPITWIGTGLLLTLCLVIFYKQKIKLNFLYLIILVIALLPTFFNLSNSSDINLYTFLRVFSFLGFSFTLLVFTKTHYQEIILRNLKAVFFLMVGLSIYTYFAQLFNFYEPFRNRPGTGILGFDAQQNFWISGSHRLVGTFREPVFLVSLLFPSFLVIHFQSRNSKIFYIISALIFGLTKSELAIVFVGLFILVQILLKNFDFNSFIFLLVFLVCFFVPIKECDISPNNIECPSYTEEEINDKLKYQEETNSTDKLIVSLDEIEFQDRERSDTISFGIDSLKNNTGFGFQHTNQKYTDYLSQDVSHEMYLVNRSLPEYLKVKYLTRTFGTGRYFLVYENINIQNNFLFNLFSIGMFYLLMLIFLILYSFNKSFEKGLKVSLIILCISLASVEDLLPIFGLYLSLMFTMERNENK